MGCHTWFSRPITTEEFKLIKEYAPIEIYNATGDTKENIEMGAYNQHHFDMLMKSYTENIPCVYGKYYWQWGYGYKNPELLNGNAYIYEVHRKKGLFVDIPEYYDTFRVKNYPRKIIHSRKELRRYLKKAYFTLSKEQLEKISQFFRVYPDGIISFR